MDKIIIHKPPEKWERQLICRRIVWWPKTSSIAASCLVAVCLAFWFPSQRWIPKSSVGRHFMGKTILEGAINPHVEAERGCKGCSRPEQVFWTLSVLSSSQIADQELYSVLKSTKYSKATILQRCITQNLHCTFPLNTSKIQTIIFGTRYLP